MFQKISTYTFPAFITLLVCFFISQQMDVELIYPEALIGAAGFDLVDVHLRIKNFYGLIALAGILFSALILIERRLKISNTNPYFNWINAMGIINTLHCFNNPENIPVSLLLLGISLASFVPFKSAKVFVHALLIGFSTSTITLFFMSYGNDTDWSILLILVLPLLFFVFWKLWRNQENLSNLSWSFPLLLLPLLQPLSGETYLIFNQNELYLTTPIGWYVLFLLGILIWAITIRKKGVDLVNHYTKFLIGFVTSIATLAFYSPYYTFTGDLFELANPANAMMRMFEFNEIPFIDFFSSHVLYEQLFQSIYVIFNGYYSDLSFMIYAFLIKVLIALVTFLFLRKTLNNSWAIVLLLLFPFTEVLIPPTFGFALIAPLLLNWHFKSRSIKSLYFLFAWMLFSILWRVDLGVSVCPAVLVILAIDQFQLRDWNAFKKLVLHGAVFGLVCLLIALGIHFSSGGVLFPNLILALDYLGASQAHAYSHVTNTYETIYFLHYIVFPLTAILFLVYIIIDKTKIGIVWHWNVLAIIYLGLFYLLNAQRGLVRHGFNENYDLYISSIWFLFASLSIYHLIEKKKKGYFVIIASFLILAFHFPNSNSEKSMGNRAIFSMLNSNHIPNGNERIDRVEYSEESNMEAINQLSDFINSNLKENETFIDFSHSPMLYFFTHQRVPSYFNQYVQNTITPNLLENNVKKLNDVGMVVYGRSPRNPIDYLDGVPNELRYFALTEYIYSNFSPSKIISGYRIWEPNGADKSKPNSVIQPFQYDHLRSWPKYLGSTVFTENKKEVIIDHNELLLFDHNPSISDAIEFSFDSIPENAHHSAWLELYSASNLLVGQIELDIFHSDQPTYIIPFGYQYCWYNNQVETAKLVYPEHLQLSSLNLIQYAP